MQVLDLMQKTKADACVYAQNAEEHLMKSSVLQCQNRLLTVLFSLLYLITQRNEFSVPFPHCKQTVTLRGQHCLAGLLLVNC